VSTSFNREPGEDKVEFRKRCVRFVDESIQNGGTISGACSEIGIAGGSYYAWKKNPEVPFTGGPPRVKKNKIKHTTVVVAQPEPFAFLNRGNNKQIASIKLLLQMVIEKLEQLENE
jgi:hypothetical protein